MRLRCRCIWPCKSPSFYKCLFWLFFTTQRSFFAQINLTKLPGEHSTQPSEPDKVERMKNKAVYTPPKSQMGGQERNSNKTLVFCFCYGRTDRPTDRPTRQVLLSRKKVWLHLCLMVYLPPHVLKTYVPNCFG